MQWRPLSSGDKTGGGGRCFWSHTHRTDDGSLAAGHNAVSVSVFHCDAMGAKCFNAFTMFILSITPPIS